MTLEEHEFMGQLLYGLVAVFFLVVLPVGVLVRRKKFAGAGLEMAGEVADDPIWETPGDGLKVESSSADDEVSLAGKSRIPAPSRLDLLGVGFYVLLFLMIWKASGNVEGGGAKEFSVGVVLVNALSFVFLAAMIPAALFWRTSLVEFFGLRWKKWPRVFAIAPAFVIGLLAVAGIFMLVSKYPEWVASRFGGQSQEVVQMLKNSQDPMLVVALVLSAVVIAPLAEEVIFRGYIFRVTREYTGLWSGALFSGLLFGVIHFNVLGFPVLALFGVALALIYEKTKSIWAPIACHAAFNGFQVTMALVIKYGLINLPTS